MSEKEYLEIKRLNETLVKRIEYLENENKKLQERPTQCYSSEDIKSIIKDLIDTKTQNRALTKELRQLQKEYKNVVLSATELKEQLKSQMDEFQNVLELAAKDPTIKM